MLRRRLTREGSDAAAVIRATMGKAREVAGLYPRLRSRLESASIGEYAQGPERTFEVGLRALLDGLAADLEGVDAASKAGTAAGQATKVGRSVRT
ncbi:TetR/AcrR family transcriptional regulator C-terminal domain-containing protein [Hamadaea sp. NPDC051192]|uniref:TetR/AcrR family transcriptional regulator C-terminal domain-containing protein n=1 Tax=Hamadaea sp. NPDC051192 TaxID=3154940 RepID=UPI0034474580